MKRTSKNKSGRIGILAIFILFTFILQQYLKEPENPIPTINADGENLQVHFIDVGQGDSILIKTKDHAMLIDAGENNRDKTIVDYLHKQNITKLDYVVGTHPHSDHIGGLDTVIKSFTIDKVIMPDVVHNTKTFEDVLDAIDEKNLSITKAVSGDEYTLGNASFTILAPNSSSYQDLNNYSIVIKLTNGNNTFLFTGDAESLSEKEMLQNNYNLSANVLKLGHHGSTSSSSKGFLDAVSPTYAVVCAGIDNQYGHPHVETLQAMFDRNIKLYRTDKQGTLIFISDGQNITTNTDDYPITTSDLERNR